MVRTVMVNLGDRSYSIHIGTELTFGAGVEFGDGVRGLIVTDSNVDPLYGESFAGKLRARGVEAVRAVVPAGESSKSMEVLETLYEQAVTAGLDRSGVVVALGGGVVGDLAGFMAATYLRGVRFLQVPTTLLAMVDSSVGGKTAINLRQGKNLVGAFYQPVEVTADLATLATLPQREYVSGLAEVIKYGIIWDATLFQLVEREAWALLERHPAVLEEVVARCCEIKAEVVAMDEREGGVRSILNFGHTLGHGIEQVCGYGRWLHGEAVAAGMAFATRVSLAERDLPEADGQRILALLDKLGLPVGKVLQDVRSQWPALRVAIASDKKTRGGVPRFVLARKLGSVVFDCEVEEKTLERIFRSMGD